MWENKTIKGPHHKNVEEEKTTRKHKHRDRANETTFEAKYTFDILNMSLVSPDEPNGKTWSFKLAAGEDQRIVRRIKKDQHETPGISYKLKTSSQFKFTSAQK